MAVPGMQAEEISQNADPGKTIMFIFPEIIEKSGFAGNKFVAPTYDVCDLATQALPVALLPQAIVPGVAVDAGASSASKAAEEIYGMCDCQWRRLVACAQDVMDDPSHQQSPGGRVLSVCEVRPCYLITCKGV